MRRLLKLSKFCDFARSLAELSTCSRDKVGVITFADDFSRVHSIGYNGPPTNVAHTCLVNLCNCAHAEMNAIVKGGKGILFTTRSPCMMCTNAILNCKLIHTVIYDEEYRKLEGLDLLREAGITVWKYSEITVI